jgi:hypothetical protein
VGWANVGSYGRDIGCYVRCVKKHLLHNILYILSLLLAMLYLVIYAPSHDEDLAKMVP